jgi:hypothetical protein
MAAHDIDQALCREGTMPMRSRPRLFLGPEHSRAGREAAPADRVARAGVRGVAIGAKGGRR